ncbi:MAG: 2-C-methyl-D-erythritol 4-phosphate cytidylyltransferase [Verrucomicrobia bacterium]|nr:MAG: 2-C-methyl-D-erythritol 4-phosphate cytidylyltransferase [Verrucomicrobiota bacterium]
MLTAILVAAGNSERMGFDKLFATIAGKPVIAHAIRAFERAGSVDGIIVVGRENRHAEIKTIVRDENFKKVRTIIPGGKYRQDSVRAGLEHLDAAARYVAVHDAARPLVTPEQIERVFEQCRVHGAAAIADPVNETVKRADTALLVTDSVDRHQLYAMQTPQIFERQLIDDAYRAVYADAVSVTDEVSAVERLCRKVLLVLNDDFNFKITYPRDLPLAEFVLTQRAAKPVAN